MCAVGERRAHDAAHAGAHARPARAAHARAALAAAAQDLHAGTSSHSVQSGLTNVFICTFLINKLLLNTVITSEN